MKTLPCVFSLLAASLGLAASAWGTPLSIPNLSTTNYYGVNSSADWNVSGGSVDIFGWGGYGFDSPSGSGTEIDMDGSSVGQISTILDVTSPGNVTIGFWLGANFDGPPAIKQLELALDSTNAPVLDAPSNSTWAYVDVTFYGIATGDHLLQFTSLDGGLGQSDYYGPVLNDVSASVALPVQAAPDAASTLLLLLAGMGVLLGARGLHGRKSDAV